tara:strand:- start:313 stop:621 length:309 start_codon:yes stop_codon:yes gene_type:complete
MSQENKKERKMLGARLKVLRLEQDLTQVALADRLGVERTFWVQIELGITKLPLKYHSRLCSILQLNSDWMVSLAKVFQPDVYAWHLEVLRGIEDNRKANIND